MSNEKVYSDLFLRLVNEGKGALAATTDSLTLTISQRLWGESRILAAVSGKPDPDGSVRVNLSRDEFLAVFDLISPGPEPEPEPALSPGDDDYCEECEGRCEMVNLRGFQS